MATVLHLVRHGESEWNVARRVQGGTAHVPLTARGRGQATQAAAVLGQLSIRSVRTSDQARAAQTAAIIGERCGVVPITEPRLREQGLGDLEGLGLDEALRQSQGIDWTDADSRPGGGESIRDVYLRIASLLAQLQGSDGEHVLVSHGDTIRIICALLDGLPPDSVPYEVPANGSITTRTLVAGW